MLGKRSSLQSNKDENNKSNKSTKLSVNDTIIDNKDIAFKSNPSTLVCSLYGSISINENRNLISFGDNSDGCLGHEEINKMIYPPKQIPNLLNIKMVDRGGRHTVCIDYEGKLFTFGNNEKGQLGMGKNENELPFTHIPQQLINIPPIDYISCGDYFTICITNERTLYSFGENNDGQLGIGNNNNCSSPQLINNLNDIEFIKCGDCHVICKTYSNEYYSWGDNECGQLGQGNDKSYNEPIKCLNWPEDIVDINCGYYQTLLLTSTGHVYSFGDDGYGQLGLNDKNFSSKNIPTLIQDLPLIKRIACGNYYSTCIDINNNLWVFGDNYYGQLGLGDKKKRRKPTLNESLHDIIDISSGGNHTFVKTIKNEIYSFGNNEYSQLGIETSEDSQSIPIQVFKDNEDIWASNERKSKQKSARK